MRSTALLRKLRLVALITLGMCVSAMSAADTYPKREVRGVWVAALGIDWPLSSKGTTTSVANTQKSEITSYLDQYKSAGINVVYIQVRPMGDRMFLKTSYTDASGNTYTVYEPFSHYVSGSRGTEAAYDPLEYWISEAHKRGMELYAWVNPYRWYQTATSTDPGAASSFVPSNYTSYDRSVVSQGSIIHSHSNNTARYCFNPGLASTNTRIKNACAVITGNYDVDGIVFDDYFYPDEISETTSAEDYSTYKSSGTTLSIGDWRRQNVNNMIALCSSTIHSIKPWVRFGVAPAGVSYHGVKTSDGIPSINGYAPSASDWQYDDIYSDPIAWMRDKSVDFISPQLYWASTHSTNPYGPLAKWWNLASEKLDCQFFPSMSLSGGLDVTEYTTQINLTRQHSYDNNSGVVLYSSRYTINTKSSNYQNQSFGTSLKTNAFPQKAIHPAMNRNNGTNPGVVSGLAKSGATLSWTAISNMRYVAYAIPETVNPADAVSDRGGYRAEYIIDVCYSNSVTIPSGKTTGYWYAVTPLDRFGNEWEATNLGAPTSEQVEVELVSPANGITADYVQQFSWTGTEGATFTLEIADSEDFSNIVYNQSTTANSLTVDLEEWQAKTKFYWRVRGSKIGAYSATSEVRSFTTGEAIDYPDLAAVQLVSPANNAEFSSYVTFTIRPTANATKYLLQLSTTPDFKTISYSTAVWNTSGTNLSAIVSTSALSDGEYYWRVIASASKYDSSTSETRIFYYEAPGGEQDYEMYHEPTIYDNHEVSNTMSVVIRNIWLRDADHNPIADNLNSIYCRDMVARPADTDQRRDIVYICGRTANTSSKTDNFLARFDASNGRRLEDLALSYDSQYSAGYAGANDLMLDADNNLLISTLAVSASSTFTVSKIDVTDGSCTTLLSVNPSYRVDHAAVYGSINNSTYYIFAIENSSNSTTYAVRYTITNGNVAETRRCRLSVNHSTAPTIHPVSATRFYVNGQSGHPTAYNIGNNGATITAQATISTIDIRPSDEQITGCDIFDIDGFSFMVMPYKRPANNVQWQLLSGNNFNTNFNGAERASVFPQDGLGTNTPTSGDLNQPISVLKPQTATRLSGSEMTRLFVYSPGNGLAAYNLYVNYTTAVNDIVADEDNAKPEYYNLQGVRVTPSAPGIYIRRIGTKVSKVMIK